MRRSGQIACKNRKIIGPWGNIDYKTIDTKKKFMGFVIKSANSSPSKLPPGKSLNAIIVSF